MQNNNEKPLTIHGENFTMEEAFNNVVESYEKLKEMHEELTVDEELSQINEKIELGKMRIHELEGGLEHLRFIRDVLISRKDIVRADNEIYGASKNSISSSDTSDEQLSQINEKFELGKMRIDELSIYLQQLRFIRDEFISRKDIVRADIINAQLKEARKWLDEQYQIVQMYSHCISCIHLSRANKI
jgi:hypothetical protein